MINKGKCKSIYYFKNKKYVCSLELAMDLIGGKWKSVMLFHLIDGPKRSGELQREMNGINNKMFTQTARELESVGLVNRKVFPVVPPKVEYSLSEKGLTVVPLVEQMAVWGHSMSEDQE